MAEPDAFASYLQSGGQHFPERQPGREEEGYFSGFADCRPAAGAKPGSMRSKISSTAASGLSAPGQGVGVQGEAGERTTGGGGRGRLGV